MNDHEHDYWATQFGGMTCACGASRRPLPAPAEENIINTEETTA